MGQPFGIVVACFVLVYVCLKRNGNAKKERVITIQICPLGTGVNRWEPLGTDLFGSLVTMDTNDPNKSVPNGSVPNGSLDQKDRRLARWLQAKS